MTNSNLLSSNAIAQTELEQHLEAQVDTIAPEPANPDAAKIRLIMLHQVREARNQGEYFWQVKQGFKRNKDFKAWVDQEGFVWRNVCKHIKVV